MLTANNNNKTSLSERKMMAKFPRMASLYDQCLRPATEANLSGVFSHFFSNHNQYLPQSAGDNQASINSQTSDQKISRHFHGNSWSATNHGWNKCCQTIRNNCTSTWSIFKSDFWICMNALETFGNPNYLLKARDIICSLKSRDWGQQYI